MNSSTRIGERDVPVKSGEIPIVTFSAGKGGESEAGDWEFWTAVIRLGGTAVLKVTNRRRVGVDPGERFRRIESEKGNEETWARVQEAEYLRPATDTEVDAGLIPIEKTRVLPSAQIWEGLSSEFLRKADFTC